jgi:hypothetical protein
LLRKGVFNALFFPGRKVAETLETLKVYLGGGGGVEKKTFEFGLSNLLAQLLGQTTLLGFLKVSFCAKRLKSF